MARVTSNALIKGLSGKLGDALVFRTYRGKTFVSVAARKPDKKKETQAQRATRVTFQQASEWASAMMLDPNQKAYYKQRAKALKLPNAYTAALTDYMRKSKVVTTRQHFAVVGVLHQQLAACPQLAPVVQTICHDVRKKPS